MNNYFINEKVAEGERNQRRAHCFLCNDFIEKGEGYRVFIPSRGIRVVCSNHYINRGLIGYHSNARRGVEKIGTTKKGILECIPVGIEFEGNISNSTYSEFTTFRAMIEAFTFCHMERDCTVSGELPTQPMEGLARISKILQSLESHNQLSILSHNSCGAHIHAQCNDISYIRRYYHSIFIPLNNYIEALSNIERIEIFGSDFRSWARPIDENTDPEKHENIFNTQHERTLEFRLPRIIGYKQYMNCIKFWREVVCYINNYDFKKDSDAITRKVEARKCGNKLVNIARKYF